MIASGIKNKDTILNYSNKLHHLCQQFIHEKMPPPAALTTARMIFDWLWEQKTTRYEPHGSYRLSDVIDAQISKDIRTVGNCLGLTLLYNCLLRRIGIEAEALYLENAFEMGPHVLTILKTKESVIDIENIFPYGFNYKGHINDPSRIRWGSKELVADVYLSIGNEFFEKGEFIESLKSYTMSIKLNPQFERAHLNKAIVLNKIEKGSKI